MKNEPVVSRLIAVCLGVLIVLTLVSWAGSACGWEVRSLLNAEGLRWFLKYAVTQVYTSLFLELFVLLAGLGVLTESGLPLLLYRTVKAGHRRLYRKKRQALILAVVVGLGYVVAVGWGAFSQKAILTGVTGTLDRSPFTEGWSLLLSLGLALVGGVYGLASGQFRSMLDVFRGLSALVAAMSGYFVYLFLAIQVFAVMQRAQLDTCWGISEAGLMVLQSVCFYLPFLYLLAVYMTRLHTSSR